MISYETDWADRASGNERMMSEGNICIDLSYIVRVFPVAVVVEKLCVSQNIFESCKVFFACISRMMIQNPLGTSPTVRYEWYGSKRCLWVFYGLFNGEWFLR